MARPQNGGLIGLAKDAHAQLRYWVQIGDDSPQEGRLTGVVRDVFNLMQHYFANGVPFVAKRPRFIPRLIVNRCQKGVAVIPSIVKVLYQRVRVESIFPIKLTSPVPIPFTLSQSVFKPVAH